MPRCVRATFVFAAFLMLLPPSAFAQQGQIAGTVRDAQGGGHARSARRSDQPGAHRKGPLGDHR